ncbi:hypothetical protein [Clostridium sp. YIM B02555]|uniref:hypothetical protein n=1 Tax=Clostridium sp. YIM B02555 TaxID=2911968 RepID=UPI001EED5317|nr:hypothetical protein [Clostridium sp. YIM B02555]
MNKDIKDIDNILEEYGQSIPVPIELLINPKYNKDGDPDRLRHNDAILYGLLSALPKEKDKDGKEYVAITGEKISIVVGTTNSVSTRMLKQLEKFDLIERDIKRGQPQKIYVKEIIK